MPSLEEFELMTKDCVFYNAQYYLIPDGSEFIYADYVFGYLRAYFRKDNSVYYLLLEVEEDAL